MRHVGGWADPREGLPWLPSLSSVRTGHRGPRQGLVLGPSDRCPPPPSSSEESERNLRNLAEDEARACAILIK